MSCKNLMMAMLYFLSAKVFAQNTRGTVKSQGGKAPAFADLAVLNSSSGAVADKDGNFSLELKIGG